MKHWVGCSGFHYKHWKDVFYPKGLPQKKWFDFYTQYFNTLELNVTFYRFPQLSFLENWYEKAPENFIFSLKVPKAITHFKQFNDTKRMVDDFYGTIREGLKEKLGCVLFQLPPPSAYTEERLEKIFITSIIRFRMCWNSDMNRGGMLRFIKNYQKTILHFAA